MIGKRKRFERMFIISILTLCLFFGGRVACMGQKVVLTAKVIAFENSLLRVTKLTDIPRKEIVFLKVETVSRGKETSEFIKIEYPYFGESNALPKSLFEGKSRWKFVLRRNKECDQTGYAEDPAAPLVTIDENERLPKDLTFPCYVLKTGKAKPVK